jgi:biopolymer transport protein ExbB/TolQ
VPEQPWVPVWAAAGFIGTVLAAGWIGHRFIRQLSRVKTGSHPDIAALNLLRETEHGMWKSLDHLKLLIRIGPGLGLIGTLIPMGTGLAALSQGDLARLSGDLVAAFTTTVVGMALGLISYLFFTIQRRWRESPCSRAWPIIRKSRDFWQSAWNGH